MGVTAALVATAETTTSTSYTDLTTAGPSVTVTVPASGAVLVTITAQSNNGNAGRLQSVAFVASGSNTLAASDTRALIASNPGSLQFQGSATFYVSGLAAGSTTFKLVYKTSQNTATFANRSIIVTPAP
jgi:hypothetical protein